MRLWRAAQALKAQIGAPLPPTDQDEVDQQVAVAREWLGEAEWTAAWEEGRAMTMEQAVADALQ